jgi:hypothetical protein
MYDVFLSHSHADAARVENLAERLVDDHGLNPWLDRWVLVPGKPWQQAMAKGIEEAQSCAICLGSNTPQGWFRREVEKALNRQSGDESFGVIPVLLPGARAQSAELMAGTFAELNTWVDFSRADIAAGELHLLVCGIKGIPPGRPPRTSDDGAQDPVAATLRKLQALRTDSLVDETIVLEYQRKILDKYLEF